MLDWTVASRCCKHTCRAGRYTQCLLQQCTTLHASEGGPPTATPHASRPPCVDCLPARTKIGMKDTWTLQQTQAQQDKRTL